MVEKSDAARLELEKEWDGDAEPCLTERLLGEACFNGDERWVRKERACTVGPSAEGSRCRSRASISSQRT